jgi:hypothetical protein
MSINNSNMRSFLKGLLVLAIVCGTGYTFAKSNPVATDKIEDRHLSGFHAVSLAGSFDVYITQGTTESVKVEAPDDLIDRIITEVDGGVLKIHEKEKNWHWNDSWGHKKIAIYVVAKDLNAIGVAGSGDIYFKEGITTNSLKLNVTGSGDMLGKVNVKTLESSISGSGDMKLSGRADNSTVTVVGSGDFTAPNMATVNTTVRVTGSGDARVNASDKIEASVAGSGDVHYTGGAKSVSSSKSGSGEVTRM